MVEALHCSLLEEVPPLSEGLSVKQVASLNLDIGIFIKQKFAQPQGLDLLLAENTLVILLLFIGIVGKGSMGVEIGFGNGEFLVHLLTI